MLSGHFCLSLQRWSTTEIYHETKSTSANCNTSHDIGKSLSVCEINFVKIMKINGYYYIFWYRLNNYILPYCNLKATLQARENVRGSTSNVTVTNYEK